MTKLLRETIKQVEQLSDGEQDAAAVAMLDYLAHRRDLRVSDEQLAEIRRRRADPNRTFVSHDEARERIKRLGA
jgi:hypothetical protein